MHMSDFCKKKGSILDTSFFLAYTLNYLFFFSASKIGWKRSTSFATTPLITSIQIKFGIAINALAISEKFHTTCNVVVAPTNTIKEKTILYIILYLCVPNMYSKAFSPWYSQPKIVENANNAIPIVTRIAPTSPKADLKARMVSAAPSTTFPSAPTVPRTPDEAIHNPVIVHTTIVSQNVPVILIYPCRTGSSVVAAAAVIAAEPIPASLEKTPRATPNLMAFITLAVIVPATLPAAALGVNAIFTIITTPDGRFSIFIKITINPAIT